MLAGEPPHAGTTAQAIIAKLMTEEPRPVSVLRKSVPPHVDAAIARALDGTMGWYCRVSQGGAHHSTYRPGSTPPRP